MRELFLFIHFHSQKQAAMIGKFEKADSCINEDIVSPQESNSKWINYKLPSFVRRLKNSVLLLRRGHNLWQWWVFVSSECCYSHAYVYPSSRYCPFKKKKVLLTRRMTASVKRRESQDNNWKWLFLNSKYPQWCFVVPGNWLDYVTPCWVTEPG